MMTKAALLIALPLTFALGCRTPEPKSPDEGLTQINPPEPPDLGRGADRIEYEIYSMFINDNIRSSCAGPSPFFSFASAKTTAQDNATMNVLAHCMTSGALKDKSIVLVGRTDPRGSEQYNEKLGLARAERVKRYLISRGVEDSRVRTASLGKDDASPSPRDWPTDRRVEIRLAQ